MKQSDITAARLEALHTGHIETTTLVESLAMDFAVLMRNALPDLPQNATEEMALYHDKGITIRMVEAGKILLRYRGDDYFAQLASHPCDIIRGFACYHLAAINDLSLSARLEKIRPLADDQHFGVREWAWLVLRPHLIADVASTLSLLTPWALETSPFIRRFSCEAIRPRGVWTTHFQHFKEKPQDALPILVPLQSDESRYVQDSVGNWLNDAAKSKPDWVKMIVKDWQKQSPTKQTAYILRRASRSLK